MTISATRKAGLVLALGLILASAPQVHAQRPKLRMPPQGPVMPFMLQSQQNLGTPFFPPRPEIGLNNNGSLQTTLNPNANLRNQSQFIYIATMSQDCRLMNNGVFVDAIRAQAANCPQPVLALNGGTQTPGSGGFPPGGGGFPPGGGGFPGGIPGGIPGGFPIAGARFGRGYGPASYAYWAYLYQMAYGWPGAPSFYPSYPPYAVPGSGTFGGFGNFGAFQGPLGNFMAGGF